MSSLLGRMNDRCCGAIMPQKRRDLPAFDTLPEAAPAGPRVPAKVVVYSCDADKVGSVTARLK